MINIETARPTAQKLLDHIEEFEKFCTGESTYSPERFRDINQELSVGAVLTIGKYKVLNTGNEKRLLWQGLDNTEHDLGNLHDANIMRDYPGFHSKRSLSLAGAEKMRSEIIMSQHGRKAVTMVTINDEISGIGTDYRTALRNAALKYHLQKQFNTFSLSNLWKQVWGTA